QTRLLGKWDELGRRDEPAFGVLPADERFRTDAPRVRERDHRLEEDAQLAALERAVQGVLGRVSSERSGAHGLVEDIDAASAAVFGVIHRGVGVAKQLLWTLVAVGSMRDTDARAHKRVVAAHDERLRHDAEQAVSDLHG